MSLTKAQQYQTGIAAAIVSRKYSDDGRTPIYERGFSNPTPGFLAHASGIARTGVRFDAGSSAIGQPITSCTVFCRKTGSPIGPITVCIRKNSDGTIGETLGTFDVQNAGPAGTIQSFACRKPDASYNIVALDRLSVEFPSGTSDIYDAVLNTTQGAVANHTSQSFNGSTWSEFARSLVYIERLMMSRHG
jgi:hypothetical protein